MQLFVSLQHSDDRWAVLFEGSSLLDTQWMRMGVVELAIEKTKKREAKDER